VSCLLYRLSYIAVADKVASCAGTHSSNAAACQCGSNHNRWRQTLTETSVTMSAHVDRHGRASKFVASGAAQARRSAILISRSGDDRNHRSVPIQDSTS
jgi:hypothetical protein